MLEAELVDAKCEGEVEVEDEKKVVMKREKSEMTQQRKRTQSLVL